MASLVGSTQQQLELLFDAVGVADRVIRQCFAVRAEGIDQIRRSGEAHTASSPLDARSFWTWEEIAARELSRELDATLRIPERTAVNLLEESRALPNDQPAALAALAGGGSVTGTRRPWSARPGRSRPRGHPHRRGHRGESDRAGHRSRADALRVP
ncbi:hypothetical protein E3O19_01190 [Cryobacterium algoritolerans]|uniref:DUF222 domain-containing protein n=1 Tax=Cryobacterium algoritolerans TaxID=1259184 RepID=A0A4R8WWY4_9MICO|nr:hypothetical protein [Cryobacterium algoritolerans]TFC20019.1 hypothetical protein E3O19_01190 [Cryobacterium algoritolerans]